MKMAGKTVIMTGASSGIVRAIPLLFTAEGANVVIADVTPHHKVSTDSMRQADDGAKTPRRVGAWGGGARSGVGTRTGLPALTTR